MSPGQIRRKLTERIAYLEAQLARGTMPPHRARYNVEEIAALRGALERLGLLDPVRVEAKIKAVTERVLPVEERKFARRVHWRQSAEELVHAIGRAVRVA